MLVKEFVLMKVVILVLVILLMEKTIILGCDASSSSHANNIIVLGKDFIQGLTTTGTGNTVYAEKIHKTNMAEPNKVHVLSLHYNGDDSHLFVNGVDQLKFKAQSFTDNMMN